MLEFSANLNSEGKYLNPSHLHPNSSLPSPESIEEGVAKTLTSGKTEMQRDFFLNASKADFVRHHMPR